MNTIAQINIRDVPHSGILDTKFREKVEKLEKFYRQIMRCRVVVELSHTHKRQGRIFNVRFDITVPGNELVVNQDTDEDVYVAVRQGCSLVQG